MSGILPFRSDVEVTNDTPKVVDLDDDESEAVFEALSSDTSREIYRTLYEEPATASQIAEDVGTSVQNVRYHVDKLRSAGLIDRVDTWYSSRGNEMAVYAATDTAIIVSGDRFRRSDIGTALESVITGLVVLAAASVALHYFILDRFANTVLLPPEGDEGAAIDTESFASANDIQPLATESELSEPFTSGGFSMIDAFSLPPGVLVAIGGVIALIAVSGYWIARGRYSGSW